MVISSKGIKYAIRPISSTKGKHLSEGTNFCVGFTICKRRHLTQTNSLRLEFLDIWLLRQKSEKSRNVDIIHEKTRENDPKTKIVFKRLGLTQG